jgi:hypothetical protein
MKHVTILTVFVLAFFVGGRAYGASNFHGTSGNATFHGDNPIPDGNFHGDNPIPDGNFHGDNPIPDGN